MHQLQVVDQDHVDAVSHLCLSGLELKGQFIHDRRVVDVDRSLAKRPERIGHTIELGLCQKPSVQALGVDLGLLCQQAFGELFLRHLEAEDGDRLLRFKCGMQPDVESERSVVDEDVLRHEIASLWNREVINLVLAGRDDRNDLIPIDLVTG